MRVELLGELERDADAAAALELARLLGGHAVLVGGDGGGRESQPSDDVAELVGSEEVGEEKGGIDSGGVRDLALVRGETRVSLLVVRRAQLRVGKDREGLAGDRKRSVLRANMVNGGVLRARRVKDAKLHDWFQFGVLKFPHCTDRKVDMRKRNQD